MPEGKGSQVTTTWILLLSVLQLTQSDSPPRPAPSRPRTFGVVSLWMNRRRVGGAVSGLLTLLVRFGVDEPSSSRRRCVRSSDPASSFRRVSPPASCCRFADSDVEGCLKNFLSSGPNLPEASPCEPWSLRRTRPASCTPMKARNGRLKKR